MSAPTTAVIGAGVAGLACARALGDAGAAVRVYDKGRGPGGRCATRRAPPHAFDHGAQYFTVRDPAFAEVVRGFEAHGAVARWEGRIGALERGRFAPSEGETERWVGVPGMSALGRALSSDLDVELATRIERVERNGGWWLVREDRRREGPFDALAVAVPAAQAVTLLDAAPDLQRRVAAVEMAPCQAAMVAFAEPLDAPFDGAFVSESPLSWIARDGSKPDRKSADCWTLHASARWSAAHLEREPAEVAAALVDALADALGRALPAVEHAVAHRWRYALSQDSLGADCAWDEALRLGVCGDWCIGGRVEGAWLSGRALAARIAGEGLA